MAKSQSVINLDPIDRKKELGFFGRLLITRWSGGKSIVKSEPFGHYMFCGPQGSGKTSSVLWYAEKLRKKYKKRKIQYWDSEKLTYKKFKVPPKIKLYSNFGVGREIDKKLIYETVKDFDPYANEVRIVLIDEIHTYFPKDHIDRETKDLQKKLINIFSQLRKRNTYILTTAQVYGRLDKSLREQCLYMVSCKVNFKRRLVNEFIPEHDILCDDLGRWKGTPKHIYVHGLSKLEYDTKRIIQAQ